MAVVKIWSVKSSLNKVIDYAVNDDKTKSIDYTEEDLQALHDVIDYATSDFKTEQKHFVTGINCQPEYAVEQMQETKEMYHKTDGILAFHAYQSFAVGEVDADTAHKIGVAFAQKMWGDDFEVVVATHTNCNHIHNHFVCNSVSLTDGKKFNACKKSYSLMREISDELCKEHQLSVVENPKSKSSKNYAQYVADKNGEVTKNNIIRRDIDECINESLSTKSFYFAMKKRGYTFNFNRKYPTIMHPNFERARRFKTLGDDYTPERIGERILSKWQQLHTEVPEQRNLIDEYFNSLFNPTYRQVYMSFVTVLEITRFAPNESREVQKYLYDEVRKLDKLIAQQNLLCNYEIDTDVQLNDFISYRKAELKEVIAERNTLRNKLKVEGRKGNTQECNDIRKSIADLSQRAAKLRKELKISERIEVTEPHIEEKIQQIKNENQQKELTQNERFRRRR